MNDTIVIVHDFETGTLALEPGTCPPAFVSFTPKVVELLRRDGSLWAKIDGDTIVMYVQPEPLYYRLTGDVDLAGGVVAQRVTADGAVWS